MGRLVFIVCQCPTVNVVTLTAEELERDYHEHDNPYSNWDYVRKGNCSICGSPVYLKTGYSKASIYQYGVNQIRKRLQEKL